MRRLSLLFCLFLFAGCPESRKPNDQVPFYPNEQQGDVTVYQDIQFEDIPVPESFVLQRDRSHSFQGSRFRNGMFYYAGPMDMVDTHRFYQQEMVRSGWTPTGGERGVDYNLLRFNKGKDRAIVVVRAYPRGSRVDIQIDDVTRGDLLANPKPADAKQK